MDVSVVIPLYNKAPHIARALDSVLTQSVPPTEVIVVDDGSTDGGGDVAIKYADRGVRLVRQENCGVSAARNRGISEARTDLIAFLDADDEWLPEHLETIRRLSKDYPECGAYATAYEVTHDGEHRLSLEFEGIPAPPWQGIIPNYLRSAVSHPVHSSAVAVPRRVFDSAGLFSVGVPLGEDEDMWCRIALKYPMCFSTQVSTVYHKDAGSRALVLNPLRNEYSIVKVVQRALRIGLIPPELRQDAYEFITFNQITVAGRNILDGDPQHARLLLLSCRGTRRYARAWWRLMLQTMLPPGWPARLKAARDAMRNFAGRRE